MDDEVKDDINHIVSSKSYYYSTKEERNMIDKVFAEDFALDWIDSWNNRDLERILFHYTDDFEMSSPVIVRIAKEPSGLLKGKETIKAYWTEALRLMPDLRFEFISVLTGINTVVIYYKGAKRRFAAEVFYFNRNGKIYKAIANYS